MNSFLRLAVCGCAVFSVLSFSGCSTVNSRIQSHSSAFASATPEQQQLMREGRVTLGFTKDMVLIALGEPDRTLVRMDATGSSERWLYFDRDASTTVYVQRGWDWGPGVSPWCGPYGRQPRSVLGVNTYAGTLPNRTPGTSVLFREGKVVEFEATTR